VKLIFLFSILFIFQSCTDWKKPKQLDKIEFLNKELGELGIIHTSFSEISPVLIAVSEVEKRMIQNSSGDTLTLGFAEVLDKYSSISPDLKLVKSKLSLIDSLFIIRQSGIESLQQDIERGVGDRSKYNENISFEKNSLEELSTLVLRCDSIMGNSLSIYSKFNGEVLEYSLALEKQNKEQ